jgi:hypothetical protein
VSLREANLAALSDHHPELARFLAHNSPGSGGVRILESASGEPTAVRAGRTFHSRHDPRAEAERQAREVDKEASTVMLYGFGLGYLAEAVRRKYPALPILVLEPDAEMFQAALASRDLWDLLSDERTFFLVASKPEEVTSVLPTLPLLKPAFLRLRPAVEANPEWFRVAGEIIRSWLLRREINLNTVNRFGKLWVRNLARNVRLFAEAPGIVRLRGLCEGLPALVVAGGPSLDAILPLLPSLRERLVVISVNTPLKRCVEAGAVPDFTVVVDPQYWASRFMDWTQPPLEPGERAGAFPIVIAEPSTHPRLLRGSATAARYLCSSLFPLGETLEAAVGEKGKLGAGGSVATAAWDLARHLGASPIFTAGLDLGYPGMRTHCKGVFTEELWLTACGRLHPLEASSFGYLREIGLFPVQSAGGGLTQTDRRMLLYKWWFENQLTIHPETRTFTLSADSVAITGMPFAPPSELLSLPSIRNEIHERITGELRAAAQETAARHSGPALRKALHELAGGLRDLQALCERALRANEALGRALSPTPTVARTENAPGSKTASLLLSELDEIDSRLLTVSQRSIVGFLLQSLIHRIADRGEVKASEEETLSDGAELYRGIMESARWQEGVIRKALSGLEASFP